MRRLVDANRMHARIKPYNISDEDWSVTGGQMIRAIHTLIDDVPTVDAVPVTRCKNCGNHRELDLFVQLCGKRGAKSNQS